MIAPPGFTNTNAVVSNLAAEFTSPPSREKLAPTLTVETTVRPTAAPRAAASCVPLRNHVPIVLSLFSGSPLSHLLPLLLPFPIGSRLPSPPDGTASNPSNPRGGIGSAHPPRALVDPTIGRHLLRGGRSPSISAPTRWELAACPFPPPLASLLLVAPPSTVIASESRIFIITSAPPRMTLTL